jgi:O-antigen ligase
VIVVVGALVAVKPAVALGLAGAAALVGVVTGIARVPVATTLVLATIAVVALVDLPRKVDLGPVTSYALITAALAVLLVPVSMSRYVLSAVRGTGLLFVPLYAFAGWAMLSVLWFRPSVAGAQNILVYAAFASLVPVTAAAIVRGDLALQTARRAITCSIIVACSLYAGSLAVGGLGASDVIGSRSFALIGVVGVAWGAAHLRYGDRRLGVLAALCWLLILLSLSRLAFAAAIVIVAAASLDLRTPARFVRSALLVGVVGTVAYMSVTSFGPMAERFAQGDVQNVGGLTLNVQGRLTIWGLTWRSYLDSPVIGNGAGSAERLLNEALDDNSHPHNDYLRVLHDFGVVGLALLVASLIGLLAHAVRGLRSARGDPETAPLHMAAVLALIGLAAGMTTDNVIVYLFVVGPIGVIVGLSVGAVRERHSGRLRPGVPGTLAA